MTERWRSALCDEMNSDVKPEHCPENAGGDNAPDITQAEQEEADEEVKNTLAPKRDDERRVFEKRTHINLCKQNHHTEQDDEGVEDDPTK